MEQKINVTEEEREKTLAVNSGNIFFFLPFHNLTVIWCHVMQHMKWWWNSVLFHMWKKKKKNTHIHMQGRSHRGARLQSQQVFSTAISFILPYFPPPPRKHLITHSLGWNSRVTSPGEIYESVWEGGFHCSHNTTWAHYRWIQQKCILFISDANTSFINYRRVNLYSFGYHNTDHVINSSIINKQFIV